MVNEIADDKNDERAEEKLWTTRGNPMVSNFTERCIQKENR